MKTVKTFEQFIAESNGNKVESMLSKLGNDVEHEMVADMMAQDEEVSGEIMAAMKKLGCKAEECAVIGDYHTDDYNKVLKVAKASGVKYIEIKDDNGEAIVFSMNESKISENTQNRTMMIQAGTEEESMDILQKANISVKMTKPKAYGGDYEFEFKTEQVAQKAEEILAKHFGDED
jgi:hypothetical protein